MIQINLGTALTTLEERATGTRKLEEAVAVYREALKEYPTEATPYLHQVMRENFDRANALLAQRRKR
jgi:hypothetical protein